MSPLLGPSNSESSLLGCAGSDRCIKAGRGVRCRAPQYKPIDSTRIGTGQSSFRGRVRCQSLFIARERRRCEPGSNSVIVTASLTRCEGHVESLGGVQRTRKIFVGCPAIRPIWDQSPGIRNRPGLRLLVTGSIHYTIKIASAVSRRRRKSKIVHAQRPDQIPPRAFHASLSLSRAGGNPAKNKAHHLPLSRSPNDRRRGAEAQTTANRPRGMPAHSNVIPAQAGTQRKTKHADSPRRAVQGGPSDRSKRSPKDRHTRAGFARVSTPSPARSVCPPRHLPACAGTTVVSKSSPRAGIAPTNG